MQKVNHNRSKITIVGVVLFVITTGAVLPVAVSAQSNPVQESEVDIDGSTVTVNTDGANATTVDNLPTDATVSNVSTSGNYNEQNRSIFYSSPNSSLPATVTFTLDPAESAYTAGSDVIEFSVDDTSVSLDVVDDSTDTSQESPSFTIEIASTTSPIQAGENLTVEVNVENVGDSSGTESVVLKTPAGTNVDNSSVTLAAGASTTSTLTWKTDADDTTDGDITISSGDNQVSEAVVINQQASSNLSVSLTTPDTITPNSSFEVSGIVENTGGGQASGGATLVVNGETVDSVSTVGGDENLTLTESVEAGKVGESYNITVSGGNVSETTTITVTDDDLVDLSLSVDAPVTVEPSASFDVSGTIENIEETEISSEATLAVDNETVDSVTEIESDEETTLSATTTAGADGSSHEITLSAAGLSTTETVQVSESTVEKCSGSPAMAQTSITTTDQTITDSSPARVEGTFGVDQSVSQQCSVMMNVEYSFTEPDFQFSGGSDWEQSDSNSVATQFEGIKAGETRSISTAVTADEADPGDEATVVATYEIWYKGNRGDSIQQTTRETITVEDGSTDDNGSSAVKVPGFGISVSLTALLSAGYILRRRLNDPEM